MPKSSLVQGYAASVLNDKPDLPEYIPKRVAVESKTQHDPHNAIRKKTVAEKIEVLEMVIWHQYLTDYDTLAVIEAIPETFSSMAIQAAKRALALPPKEAEELLGSEEWFARWPAVKVLQRGVVVLPKDP
jgi:hypothetical protein